MNKQNKQLLNFLKKQNQMLKQDIKGLKQAIRINKQALKTSLNYKNQQNYDKCIPQLVKLLYQENQKLHNRIDQLRNQIQSGMCKALISQQIAFQSTQQQILLTNQLKDRLQKMRRQLQNKEKKILQLTKLNIDQKSAIPGHPGLNIQTMKLIQYSDMNKVTKKLKDSIQKLNQQLDNKKQQIQKIKDGKQQLIKLNLILTKQLNQLKLLSSCQTTKSNNQVTMELNNADLTKYIKYQKKLANQQENLYQKNSQNSGEASSSQISDSDNSQIDQFPSEQEYNQNDKDSELSPQKQQSKANQSMHSMTINLKQKPILNQKAKMNMTLNLGNLGLKKGESASKGQQKPKLNIPKLQLTKAKQIQNLIVKKINNDQKKKKQSGNQQVKDQKYKKLQQELQNLRKKLGSQILQKLQFERECNFLKKIVAQLQQRNKILVQRKILEQQQQTYEKKRKIDQNQNIQTLLDICRDVTLNQKLRKVVLGQQNLIKKYNIQSLQI